MRVMEISGYQAKRLFNKKPSNLLKIIIKTAVTPLQCLIMSGLEET